jgi:putative phage-type endonuclease
MSYSPNVNHVIADTAQQWHEIRSKGLGGSDIGALLGLNPYKGPYQLWLEKTGQYQAPDISEKIAIQVGNEMEDLVGRLFTKQTGIRVQRDNKTYFSKEKPYLLANIDRKTIGEKSFLECKTAGHFSGQEWKDGEVPASYLLQVQHYMNVLGFDHCYIAVVIDNHDFKWQRVKRNQELIDIIEAKAKEFWEVNVKQMIAPPVDGLDGTKEALNTVFQGLPPEAKELDHQHLTLVKDILSLRADEKLIKATLAEKENKLREYLGTSEAETMTGRGVKVTYKDQTSRRIDTKRIKEKEPELYDKYTKTTTTKVLRITEVKQHGE